MGQRTRRHVLGFLACLLVVGCGGSGKVVTGATGTAGASGSAGLGGAGGAGFVELTFPGKSNNNLDVLFVIENASSDVQQKLAAQVEVLIEVLQSLPSGQPNLHIAVVSTDMGAPSDVAGGCSAKGDDGQFRAQPRGACTATTLASGATFISDVDGQKNFTDPIEKILQCITPIGVSGCGIASPLAAIERALGADGQAAPVSNTGFLRPDAYLGIVIVTSEDDCSAPADTKLYSLNGGPQSLANPLGPVAKYRCNRFGHLCRDSSGATVMPPLTAPATGGSPPIVNLTTCTSNETSSGLLTPVSTFVQHIKALKAEPDNQIVVAAITAPADPYAVEWVPPASAPPEASGELWPQIMHSCGVRGGDDVNPNATQNPVDGTFGDPGVRIAQFVHSFTNSVLGSVCDPSYANTMSAVATKVGGLIRGPCVVGHIQASPAGQPACTVTNHLADGSGATSDTDVPNCILNGNQPPCWTLATDPTQCPSGGTSVRLTTGGAVPSGAKLSTTVKCALCPDGATLPGC